MNPRGRPRTFDRTAALDCAIALFWEHGYDAVSMSQLTEAMGVSPPSLYATFGDKQALFSEAVDAYAKRFGAYVSEALDEAPDSYGAARHLLTGAAAQHTMPDWPAGCLILAGATNYTDSSVEVASELRTRRTAVADRLENRMTADIENGTLPCETDARGLAVYVITVWQGMSAAARDGHTRDNLLAVVAHALDNWPGPKNVGIRQSSSSKTSSGPDSET